MGQDSVVARLLVLGGSWFLGRAVVDGALTRGWEVTTFRRGRSGEDAPGVTVVRGDRTMVMDLARLAGAGPWDAVVDTSGYVPREVLAVARVLEPVASRYVFVSTVSVYQGWPMVPLTENSRYWSAHPMLDRISDMTGTLAPRCTASPRRVRNGPCWRPLAQSGASCSVPG